MKCAIPVVILLLLSCPLVVSTQQIRVSKDQLIWSNETWRPARQLEPGDELKTPDGRVAVVTAVKHVNAPRNLTCHALATDGPKSFFSGGVLASATRPFHLQAFDSSVRAGATTRERLLKEWWRLLRGKVRGLIGKTLASD